MTINSIKFTFRTSNGDPTYIKDVSDIVWGNMVDPVTGDFWDDGPTGNAEWIWYAAAAGSTNSFGLMGNYRYTGQNPDEKTDFNKIVAVPAAMSDGDHTVEAVLHTARVDADSSNMILQFWQVYVDGTLQDQNGPLAYVDQWGSNKPQPASTLSPPPSR